MKKKILVTIDFSEITPFVINTAKCISVFTNMELTLLHVKHAKSDPDIEQNLKNLTDDINKSGDVSCGYVVRTGSIFIEIAEEASRPHYGLTIMGSHGFKGLREVMFGADILKLLKSIPTPSLSIQKDYIFPDKGFQTILLPVASHNMFHLIVNNTVEIAKIFDAEIHLYSVEKSELKWTQNLIDNIEFAKTTFENNSVKYLRVNEPQSSFSLGYSRQTLQYANMINADLIAMMSVPAKEHLYFADGDKEQILTNKAKIPILSTNNAS